MDEVMHLEDLPAFKHAPSYARKFAEELLTFQQEEILIELDDHKFYGRKGLASNINYSRVDNQLLGEELSYTFTYLKQTIEVSLQFYENISDYYRLFVYTRSNGKSGMAFSENLTTNRTQDGIYVLKNKIKFSDRMNGNPEVSKIIRQRKQQVLCDLLSDYGFNVCDNHDIYLGEFDTGRLKGEFAETNVEQFVYDMIIIALLKGHYMGNKGYHLEFLPELNS